MAYSRQHGTNLQAFNYAQHANTLLANTSKTREDRKILQRERSVLDSIQEAMEQGEDAEDGAVNLVLSDLLDSAQQDQQSNKLQRNQQTGKRVRQQIRSPRLKGHLYVPRLLIEYCSIV